MAEHAVHHLPATEDGRLIGMVSEPAIRAALEQMPQDVDAADIKVADIMVRDICVVDMSERLDRILDQMARERLDAVAVTRKGKLAGVFTITDACASFAELLREQVRRSGGGEAA
jgi:CBS domain-containing protein